MDEAVGPCMAARRRAARRRRLGALLCLAHAPAFAQGLPPSADPGRIERRFEEPAVPLGRDGVVPVPRRSPGPPAAAAGVRFVLRGLRVEGARAIAAEELLSPHAGLIGQEISLDRVFEVAEEMTARYRRAGYVLSQVVVPAQEIRDGEVRLSAVEGFIARTEVRGGDEADRARVGRRLERLLVDRPLRADSLERQLLLSNDLPGVSARAVLAPSTTTPGAADLSVNVERSEVAGFAGVDNRGTAPIGPEQGSFGVRVNSALGAGERLSLRGAAASPARELRFLEVGLDAPVGSSGAELGLRASRADTEPGGALSPFDVEASSRNAELSLRYPVLRSRAENLTAVLRFAARDTEVEALDLPLSRDRLRVLSMAASYDVVDDWSGVNLFSAEFAQGVSALGASRAGDPLLSRANGRPDFSRLNLAASRLQDLDGGFSLLAEAAGQYAFSQLLASEEFGVGGARFGRGYDPSEIAADRGVAAVLELRYGHQLADPWLRSLQAYGFIDFGAVWRIDDSAGDRRESRASAGLGVRFNVLDDVSGSLEVARPLTATPQAEDDRNPRLFFSLVRRF